VIPARDAEATLALALAPLAERPAHWELIVVDDGSRDATARIAAAHGARVVRSERRGVGAARNTGARLASGEFLAFLDSDVVVALPALLHALRRVEHRRIACVFAVYDCGRHLLSRVGRYKNFWIRHSTLAAPDSPDWVNTSLAVLRRRDFEATGGFREGFACATGGVDLDFGRRLAQRVGRIEIDRTLEVAHHKQFTLRRLLRNDFLRARGWLRLALRSRGFGATLRQPTLANVRAGFSASVAATAAGTLLLVASVRAHALLTPALALLVAGQALNATFLVASARERIPGWAAFPLLLWIDQLACAAGLAVEALAELAVRSEPYRECPGEGSNPRAASLPRP